MSATDSIKEIVVEIGRTQSNERTKRNHKRHSHFPHQMRRKIDIAPWHSRAEMQKYTNEGKKTKDREMNEEDEKQCSANTVTSWWNDHNEIGIIN